MRLFNTVGPRQSGRYGMVIPRFVESALAGAPIEVHGDGTQTRSFCHVADTIRAIAGPDGRARALGRDLQRRLLGAVAIVDLAERVKEATGSSSEIAFVPYDQVYEQGIEDTLHREPAIGKIREAIGWSPERNLDGILADVIAERRASVA